MAVPMKRDEVSHDLISILSKSKWIRFSTTVSFIGYSQEGIEIQVITPNEL
jgi:hypothetical protein